MNRQDHIHADPADLAENPTGKDTRLSVDFLLSLLDKGWTEAQILEKHPQITPRVLRAAFDFDAEMMREETLRAVRQLGDTDGVS